MRGEVMWVASKHKKKGKQEKEAAPLGSLSPLFSAAALYSPRLSIEPQRAALPL